jgi:hypothetical protein
VLPVLATDFDQTYAVDVNGDGKLDIVAVNTPPQPSNSGPAVQYMFTVFRNDGNGTFTSLGSFPLAAPVQPGQDLCCDLYIIFALNFGDVNGDDKLDVLSQSAWVPGGNAAAPNNLNVMLNNGDGTFGAVKAVDASALGSLNIDGVAFGDLDSDGKQDLILAYANFSGRNFLGAALGNGDGTFGSFFQLQLINYITGGIQSPQVQLTEANGDGKLDAILGSGELALGNGDGTFSLSTPLFPQPANPQTPLNYPLLQMPIYAHSLPSLVYLNLTGGADAVFTPQDSSSANVSVALSPGTHTLAAHYSGDSTYAAGDSAPVTITVAPAASTVTVTSSANPSYTGENVTFTATIAGFPSNPAAGTSTVTFSDGTTTLGTSPVSGELATITTSFSTAGSHTITAAYSGDANNAASSGTVMQTVDAPVTVGGGGSGGSTSLTVASGQSVTTQVAVSGNAGFSGTVNLSCTGLPVHASCSFSPEPVTVSDKTASAAMTISTAGMTTAKSQVGEAARAVTVLACGLPLLGLIILIPVARGRRLWLCASFLLFVSAAGLTGCGGSSSSDKTAAGSYTFQVVATAGAASSTANYTLKVQ